MKDNPVIGIAIVSYKSALLTVDCLRSVAVERAASPLRIRCVVIDNASGDAPVVAAAIAANGWADWARVVVAPRNGGFAYGNNLGLVELERDGRVDFVHLLNPDTVLRPGAIDALVEFLQAHPRTGIAGGIFENGDGSEWAIAFRFPSVLSEIEQGVNLGVVSRALARWRVPIDMGAVAAPVDWVSGASMMVRREVFSRIGGLDEGVLPVLRGDRVLLPRQGGRDSRSGTCRAAGSSTSPGRARRSRNAMSGRGACRRTGSIRAGCTSR